MRGQTERNLTGGEDPQQTQILTGMIDIKTDVAGVGIDGVGDVDLRIEAPQGGMIGMTEVHPEALIEMTEARRGDLIEMTEAPQEDMIEMKEVPQGDLIEMTVGQGAMTEIGAMTVIEALTEVVVQGTTGIPDETMMTGVPPGVMIGKVVEDSETGALRVEATEGLTDGLGIDTMIENEALDQVLEETIEEKMDMTDQGLTDTEVQMVAETCLQSDLG